MDKTSEIDEIERKIKLEEEAIANLEAKIAQKKAKNQYIKSAFVYLALAKNVSEEQLKQLISSDSEGSEQEEDTESVNSMYEYSEEEEEAATGQEKEKEENQMQVKKE